MRADDWDDADHDVSVIVISESGHSSIGLTHWPGHKSAAGAVEICVAAGFFFFSTDTGAAEFIWTKPQYFRPHPELF